MNKSDFNRRRFLELAAGSFLGVTAMTVLGPPEKKVPHSPLTNPAKQLIYLYMEGGMSHIDTFDLRPGTRTKVRPPPEYKCRRNQNFQPSAQPRQACGKTLHSEFTHLNCRRS